MKNEILEGEYWKALYEEEYKIVSKVWEALGNPSYESLKGKTIWEVVADLREDAEKYRDLSSS